MHVCASRFPVAHVVHSLTRVRLWVSSVSAMSEVEGSSPARCSKLRRCYIPRASMRLQTHFVRSTGGEPIAGAPVPVHQPAAHSGLTAWKLAHLDRPAAGIAGRRKTPSPRRRLPRPGRIKRPGRARRRVAAGWSGSGPEEPGSPAPRTRSCSAVEQYRTGAVDLDRKKRDHGLSSPRWATRPRYRTRRIVRFLGPAAPSTAASAPSAVPDEVSLFAPVAAADDEGSVFCVDLRSQRPGDPDERASMRSDRNGVGLVDRHWSPRLASRRLDQRHASLEPQCSPSGLSNTVGALGNICAAGRILQPQTLPRRTNPLLQTG